MLSRKKRLEIRREQRKFDRTKPCNTCMWWDGDEESYPLCARPRQTLSAVSGKYNRKLLQRPCDHERGVWTGDDPGRKRWKWLVQLQPDYERTGDRHDTVTTRCGPQGKFWRPRPCDEWPAGGPMPGFIPPEDD